MAFRDSKEIRDEMREIVKECIISNTDVRIETDTKTCKYKPAGQALEVAFIQFLMDNGYDIQNMLINRNRFANAIAKIPFDIKLKRKTVIRSI